MAKPDKEELAAVKGESKSSDFEKNPPHSRRLAIDASERNSPWRSYAISGCSCSRYCASVFALCCGCGRGPVECRRRIFQTLWCSQQTFDRCSGGHAA